MLLVVNQDPCCQGKISCTAATFSHFNEVGKKELDFESVIFTGKPWYLLEEICEILSKLCYDFRDYSNTLWKNCRKTCVSS